MALARPFVAGKLVSYAGDLISFRVSLAVWLIDEATGRSPLGSIRVRLKERPDRKAIKNPSGYYCFTDLLPPGKYTLVIEPDPVASDWYFLQPRGDEPWSQRLERTVDTSTLDPLRPVEEIVLTPKASYPFDPKASLIRGRILREEGTKAIPVANALIEAAYPAADVQSGGEEIEKTIQTTSDAEGGYVLLIRGIKDPGRDPDSLKKKDLIVTVKVTVGDQAPQDEKLVLREGETNLLDFFGKGATLVPGQVMRTPKAPGGKKKVPVAKAVIRTSYSAIGPDGTTPVKKGIVAVSAPNGAYTLFLLAPAFETEPITVTALVDGQEPQNKDTAYQRGEKVEGVDFEFPDRMQ